MAQIHTMAAAACEEEERLGFAREDDGGKVVTAAANPSSQAAAARFLGALISSARSCVAVGLAWAGRARWAGPPSIL